MSICTGSNPAAIIGTAAICIPPQKHIIENSSVHSGP